MLAIKLKGVQCVAKDCNKESKRTGNCAKLGTNDILCGGIWKQDGKEYCVLLDKTWGKIVSRCKMSQADSVFMFLTAIVVAVMLLLAYLRLKKGP